MRTPPIPSQIAGDGMDSCRVLLERIEIGCNESMVSLFSDRAVLGITKKKRPVSPIDAFSPHERRKGSTRLNHKDRDTFGERETGAAPEEKLRGRCGHGSRLIVSHSKVCQQATLTPESSTESTNNVAHTTRECETEVSQRNRYCGSGRTEPSMQLFYPSRGQPYSEVGPSAEPSLSSYMGMKTDPGDIHGSGKTCLCVDVRIQCRRRAGARRPRS